MAYYYSTAEREVGGPVRDVEVFAVAASSSIVRAGWYWRPTSLVSRPLHWTGRAVGPFETEADALADARLADWE